MIERCFDLMTLTGVARACPSEEVARLIEKRKETLLEGARKRNPALSQATSRVTGPKGKLP